MLHIIVGSAKVGGAEEMAWEPLSIEELSSLAGTSSLLGDTKKYLLRGALNSEREDEFLDLAKAFASSPHLFVFIEEKLLKAPTTRLEKAGATIEVKKEKAAASSARPAGFDPFGLTAALAAHDRKRLWLGLTAALKAGEKPEALAGMLAWKSRQMKSPTLSRTLTSLYHDSHRGAGDLELLLERFALTL